ncbi:glycosyltransferase [Pseudomonas entomophila]|uniref:glycosyltransferase n=1 Tax=Pseudomonas entomophila TaxID=312306 RepID=UPI001BCDC7EB|nr:glycosyltransferase [Pseudomonas entomophila]QVM94078.1 glycosyltransferase [Pseudomonas entomophila]
MNIVNVMWSGGSPYMSIHKVHRDLLVHAQSDARVCNWLLLGDGLCSSFGPVRSWHLPQRLLKRRIPYVLAMPWLRWRLRKALAEASVDVLVLDGLGVARLFLPLARQMPEVRVAVLFHGKTRLSTNDVRLFRSLPPERLSIAAVSATLARSLEQGLGCPVSTLRMALDPQAFAQQLLGREDARQALALPVQGPLLGAVGRLVEGKGFEMLIEAFAQVREHQAGLRLAILGDGPLRGRLEAQAKALGVEGSVHFGGHRDDLVQLYPAFDWLLVPSRSEGLGLVVQEAVLSGVPVFCSDLPVFREQLGEAGCYLPVGDLAAWADAIGHCGLRDAAAQAREQWQAMAPEERWVAFKEGSIGLLDR